MLIAKTIKAKGARYQAIGTLLFFVNYSIQMKEDQELQKLGNRIKLIRQEVGISQDELAARCNLSRPYISKTERGLCNPTYLTLLKIAEALHVQLNKLTKVE